MHEEVPLFDDEGEPSQEPVTVAVRLEVVVEMVGRTDDVLMRLTAYDAVTELQLFERFEEIESGPSKRLAIGYTVMQACHRARSYLYPF